ncbi:MAG: glycoside hydrolase family 98 domain-containing protein, partial [Acidobacteriota bacterium]
LILLNLGLLANGEIQKEGPTIDLEPRQGWKMEGFLAMRPDDRFSLLQDGEGIAWKLVELDVDEFPIILVRAGNSLPRERWRIMVKKGESPPSDLNQAICLLDHFALEGGFIVPIRRITGWSGKVGFVLMIVISGRKGDCIEFDALEAVRLTDAKPERPKLSAPANDFSLSAPALHFCWREAANAVEYEVQVSRDHDFSEMKLVRVSPQYLTDRIPYLPRDEELLRPGKWFWRVRGININGTLGEWSETSAFDVREPRPAARPPSLSVSSERPLIILCSGEQHLVSNWNSLPEDLKSHTVFRVEALPFENLLKIARLAEENRIPVIVQTSGPHDDYGRTSSRITLVEVEQMLQGFASVKGIYICEQAFRVLPERNRIMTDYARRLIQLAAEYGRIVFWADGHWGRNLWLDVGLSRELMATIQKHPGYFIPLWKMNGSLTPFSSQSALLGFWASRAVDNWGIQPERWYWYEAGFGKLGQQAWFKQGQMEEFPPSFYGQMMLLGLSTGASVYSFEPSSDIWDQDGRPSSISRQVTFPMLVMAIKDKLISERSEILKKIRWAYVADEKDSAWALDYGNLNIIYQALYGLEHPFQIIPSTSRYYVLPILPRWTPPLILESFPRLWSSRTFANPEEVRESLGGNEAEQFRGDAWVITLGRVVFAMNSRENKDVIQSFDLSLTGRVRRIGGDLSVNSYFLAHEFGGEFLAHLNGRAGKGMTLRLWGPGKPREVTVAPEESLKKSSWREEENCLILQFFHDQRPISLKIKFSGPDAAPTS